MSTRIRNTDMYIATLCLVSLTLLVVAQVVMRVFFLAPLIGAEELVRYLLICVVFIGAPYAARNGGHIRMEEIQMWLPFRIRYALRFLAFFSAVIAFGIVSYASILTLLKNLNNRTATLSMPFWIFIFPTVLGFILLTVEYTVLFIGFLKKPDIQAKQALP